MVLLLFGFLAMSGMIGLIVLMMKQEQQAGQSQCSRVQAGGSRLHRALLLLLLPVVALSSVPGLLDAP